MRIIRNIIVALAMYSKIPMPIFAWKEEDMRYSIAFLPIVGLIIGVLEYLMVYLSKIVSLPTFVSTMLWVALPLLITGGFHVDGYMDVQDALKSYKSKEEKQQILKDPHIGAFAVISLAVYGCLYLAFSYLMLFCESNAAVSCVCAGFVLSRAVAGLISILLPHAKAHGMLHEETKSSGNGAKIILIIIALLSLGAMSYFDYIIAIVTVVSLFIHVLWYKKTCDTEFGGVSGDTIGYYITCSELIIVICAGLCSWVSL